MLKNNGFLQREIIRLLGRHHVASHGRTSAWFQVFRLDNRAGKTFSAVFPSNEYLTSNLILINAILLLFKLQLARTGCFTRRELGDI